MWILVTVWISILAYAQSWSLKVISKCKATHQNISVSRSSIITIIFLKTHKKSKNKQMKSIKGFHIQDFFFVVFRLSFVCPLTIVTGHRDFWRPKFLIKLFLGEMNRGWIESLKFTSYRNACAALPSAARWKAVRFHGPSKPLTCHEKIWHQSWQKHKGEMNDTIVVSKHQSCSILWKNNAFLFAFQRWQTTLVTGLTLSIPITQNLKQIRIKLWPCC